MRRVGRYEITGELGRGGAGLVYRAQDVRDARPVALKLMRAAGGAGDRARRRFGREVQSLLRIRHPGVVAVRDAGQHEGTPYLVVDIVEGESLADRLERAGPLSPAEAVPIARQLADALAHCHAHGILHRDLKPDNVLLDGEGRARLTDFGLAHDLEASLERSRLTVAGRLLGTPGFWPPEQAGVDLEAIGPRSDVFGLGAVLYASLTGRPPFSGETLPEVLAALDEPVEPPSAHAPGVDPLLDAVCLRCLERDPERRFGSAAEVGEALAGYATPGRPAERRRGASRARRIAAVAAIAAALAGVAAGLGAWSHRDAARREQALLAKRLAQTTGRAEALLTAVATGDEDTARAARAEAADRLARLEEMSPRLAAVSLDGPARARATSLLRAASAADPGRPLRWGPSFAADDLADPEVRLLVALCRAVGDPDGRPVDERAVRKHLDGPLGPALRLLLARGIEQERPREALALLGPLSPARRREAALAPELLVTLEEAGSRHVLAALATLSRAERAHAAPRLRAGILGRLRRRLTAHSGSPTELTHMLRVLASLPASSGGRLDRELVDDVLGRCNDLLRPIVESELVGTVLRSTQDLEAAEADRAALGTTSTAGTSSERAPRSDAPRPVSRRAGRAQRRAPGRDASAPLARRGRAPALGAPGATRTQRSSSSKPSGRQASSCWRSAASSSPSPSGRRSWTPELSACS